MSPLHRPAWLANPKVQVGLIVALLALIAILSYPAVEYVRYSWHWRKAQSAIAAHHFHDAQNHLDICRRAWPDSGETAFVAARTARRAGDLQTAEARLADARRLEWVPQQLDLESALLEVQHGNYAAVVGYLLSCVRREHPDSLLILEALEPAALRALDLPLAKECLDFWVKLDPANPQPHLDRGDLHERFLQKNDAVAEYRLAVQSAPDNPQSRLRLAKLLTELKIFDEAAPHYDWLLQHDPDNPAVQLGVARCRFEAGRKDEATKILDKLLLADSTNGAAMSLRGQIELDAGRAPEAERWFRDALKHLPNEVEVLYNLGLSLNVQGKKDEAEVIKKRREATETDLTEVAEFMKKIAQNPGDAEPRRQVAIRMIRNGLATEGKRWLELAIRVDPRHIPSYESMQKYYEDIGDLPAAAECRAQIKRLTAKPNKQ